ncbi:leucine-rich repeat domain-containing protein [bacterium]|nr:leucine-rich repeat domain-containing protein [bacterium]
MKKKYPHRSALLLSFLCIAPVAIATETPNATPNDNQLETFKVNNGWSEVAHLIRAASQKKTEQIKKIEFNKHGKGEPPYRQPPTPDKQAQQNQRIRRFINLTEVDLGHAKAKHFPVEVCYAPNLKRLKVDNFCSLGPNDPSSKRNSFTTLPPDIGELKSLETLDISYSSISELPEEIGQLTSLKTFEAQGPHVPTIGLRTLPDSFGNLKNLKFADFRGCLSLEALPCAIGGLATIDTVPLAGNKITVPEPTNDYFCF